MALCEQCGSVSIAKARSSPADKLIALLTSKRPFMCRRCGWRARRDWTDRDLDNLRDYGAGGAEPDPALAVLDEDPGVRTRGARRGDRGQPDSETFDMASLDFANSIQADVYEDATEEARSAPMRERGSVRRRRVRSHRREIVATVAVTSMVMFVVVALTMSGSCSGAGF